jgi:hypothetical protein
MENVTLNDRGIIKLDAVGMVPLAWPPIVNSSATTSPSICAPSANHDSRGGCRRGRGAVLRRLYKRLLSAVAERIDPGWIEPSHARDDILSTAEGDASR